MHVKKDEVNGREYLMEGESKLMEIPEGEHGTIRDKLIKLDKEIKSGEYSFGNVADIGNVSIRLSNYGLFSRDPRVTLSSNNGTGKTLYPSEIKDVVQTLDDYQLVTGGNLDTTKQDDIKRILGNYGRK
ncbi:MAG: hypothetical protein V1678_01180 [Candidatus Aenigmatarchaeota archaeon]